MKTQKSISRTFACALGFFFILALATTSSFAQQAISYQGIASNNSSPLQGPHSITLSIYSDSIGGSALYQEVQSAVTFTGGVFNVQIGTNKANPLPLFDAGDYSGTVRPAPGYFLGVSIDGGAELAPRSRLGAAATSWSSRFADSTRAAGTATTALNLAPSAGGVVTTVNNLSGAVTLAGSGGTTINKSGQTITISSSGGGGSGIQGVQNTDGTINITSPNGPTATFSLADGAVSTAKLAAGAVTTAKIASGAVTNAVVGSGSATNGQVLTANGSGGATWAALPPVSLTLPYSQSATSASILFSLTNSGTGYAIDGSSGGEIAIQGQSTATLGVGVVGRASDGSTITVPSGVCGTSDSHSGVVGNTQTGDGVEGFASSLGVGVHGSAGAGGTTARAGLFETLNSGATGNTVEMNNAGMGSAIKAVSTSVGGTNPVILAQNSSTVVGAFAVQGEITAPSPGANSTAVRGMNDGTSGYGIGVWGSQAGGGWGVYGTTLSGVGVYGDATGTSTSSDGVYGVSNSGNGVQGWTSTGTGVLANANTTGNALVAVYQGSGVSTTTSNNIAIFETALANKARIDNTGKGFFDGGTQTGGADVAEAFDVPGIRSSYEPGDVLVISRTGTRQVEKCSEPYSRLVAGVYATKPGVLLTPENIDADLSGKVPLGVIGVIPTKVSAENGPITAGDLLVTSSTPGHAMKADLSKLQIGEAIGKALDNFTGPGTGVIEVLVGKY